MRCKGPISLPAEALLAFVSGAPGPCSEEELALGLQG